MCRVKAQNKGPQSTHYMNFKLNAYWLPDYTHIYIVAKVEIDKCWFSIALVANSLSLIF